MPHRPHSLGPCLNRSIALLIVLGLWSVAACAQDPLVTLPNNYSSAFDNSAVAVIRAHYGPHEKIPVHDHSSFPTVFVYLDDSGQVRIDHAEVGEKPESILRPPTVKGSFRVIAGMAERHSIENLGDTSSDFLRVELRQVSLGLKDPFRGKAPQTLSENQDAVEFTDPALQIERVVCVGSSPCLIKPSPAPSLIVAFTPLSIKTEAAEERERLDAGAVSWLPASAAATITRDAASPAHILRILLPTAPK